MNKVCILIPTKNRQELLKRALSSVFAQSVPPDEVIVVNDGSTDGTKVFLEEIGKDKNIKVINREKSGGVNVARHQGISESFADWIAFLDDDDELFPDAVAHMKKRLPEVPSNCAIVFFNSQIKTNDGERAGGFQFKGEDFYDLSYEEMMVKHRIKGDCKPLFRRSLFDEGYSFPRTVNGLESDLFYTVAKDGKGIRCYPEVTTYIYFDNSNEHISLTAPKKNPWPLFLIHFRQVFQHIVFYVKHPALLLRKLVEMSKLLVHSIVRLFV